MRFTRPAAPPVIRPTRPVEVCDVRDLRYLAPAVDGTIETPRRGLGMRHLAGVALALTMACTGAGERRETSHAELPNLAPTASFTVAPARPAVGDTVVADASASHDADGSMKHYYWWVDDSAAAVSGRRAKFVFAHPGAYPLTLHVEDDRGASSALTLQVVVSPAEVRAPVAAPAAPAPAVAAPIEVAPAAGTPLLAAAPRPAAARPTGPVAAPAPRRAARAPRPALAATAPARLELPTITTTWLRLTALPVVAPAPLLADTLPAVAPTATAPTDGTAAPEAAALPDRMPGDSAAADLPAPAADPTLPVDAGDPATPDAR